MKQISTLVFLLIITNGINAQVDLYPADPLHISSTGEAPGAKINFTCRAGATVDPKDLLIIVDGIPREFKELKSLNPDDIESITILKEAAASAIYGCWRAVQGVVIITTRAASQRKFVIKDFLSGQTVPRASICFTSGSDSIKAIADDHGILIADKLKPDIKYDITVSSAGYKTFFTTADGKEQEILLEREVKLCPEVVVVAYYAIRYVTYSSTCQKMTACEWITVPDTSWSNAPGFAGRKYISRSSIYPNPVQRSNTFNLEWENGQYETLQLAVISMTGSIVSLQSKKIAKGLNRLSITADAKWSAGIYNIQLRNEKGTLVRQEKIVVQ